MGTVIAFEADGGVAIAGDTRTTAGGTVTGEVQRVFDLEEVGAGAAGDSGSVQAFGRGLDAALRERAFERDGPLGPDELARAAAEVAEDVGVEAVVATRDADGVARVRQVGPDGSVLEGPVVALGSGAGLALGRLEAMGLDVDAGALAATARDVLETVAARDAGTGEDVDVWTLGSEPDHDDAVADGPDADGDPDADAGPGETTRG